MITALLIFIITYRVIGCRRIPRVHTGRPAGALMGKMLIVIFGAGNFSLIGSVVELIVVQQSRRQVGFGFGEYFRIGALIVALTIGAGILSSVLDAGIAQGAEPSPVMQAALAEVVPANPLERSRTFRIVLVCDTDETRVRGLQGFRRLKPDEAALFVFEPPQPAEFWMASVKQPIDIIFIDAGGLVIRVFPDRRPGSLEHFPSGGRVRWVLETAANSGLRPGDRIRVTVR